MAFINLKADSKVLVVTVESEMKKGYNTKNMPKEDDGMRVDRQSCIENIGRICAEYAQNMPVFLDV